VISSKVRDVLDTDVVVAGFRSASGASRQLLVAALQGRFELLMSVPLVLKYEAVLTRPAQLAAMDGSRSDVLMLLDDLVSVAIWVRLAFRWRPFLLDPSDDMVLETGLNATADAIVTCNLRHFARVREQFHCAVLLPVQALERLEGRGQ